MKKGTLVVIDGIDGSGKTTQIELLKQALALKKPPALQGVPLEVISFPQYEDNLYGKLVKRYLEGEFGSIDEVNPYLMSLAYAGDRALAKPLIEKWLLDGKVVLANRYVSSSKAHMGANLPEDKQSLRSKDLKREEFFRWLDNLEYATNGIPREDLTILLKVDPKVGQKNVLGRHPDIHEEDLKHLEKANEIYLQLAKMASNWYVVDCMEGGRMKAREEIHQAIIVILNDKTDYDKA